MSFLQYSNRSIKDVIEELHSSEKSGLTKKQVNTYKEIYGSNTLFTQEKTWLDVLIAQYKSPIILLLLAASLLSLFLGEYTNATIIFLIIIINTFIGFYQEYRATKSVKLLEEHLERNSKVIRNGKNILLNNKELLPGDIVLLEPGDYIPADIRFIECNNMFVDESLLSGESLPVLKTNDTSSRKKESIFHANNIGFSGTIVVEGFAKGIVFAIGKETVFGSIGDLTITTVHDTKFFQNIKKISLFLIKMVIITLIALIIAHLIFKSASTAMTEILMFSVALAIGITPEALPTVTTLSLTRGAIILARHNVIIKRLSSIEDLGGLEAIYTDKTGTITKNILTIADVYSINNNNPIFYMALSGNNPFEKHRRPTSPFDYAAWDKLTHNDFTLLSEYKRIENIPFDAKHRRNLVIVSHDTDTLLIVRGAYEEIIKKTTISETEKHAIKRWVKEKAQIGCRVLAISKKLITSAKPTIWEQEDAMDLVGLIALYDPIKESVQETISTAKKLGLQIKIITGDGPEIAGHLAQNIGLIYDVNDVLTGEEFAVLSDNEKERLAELISVFARFLPEQKSEIIKILKKRRSVAYLGDGINDAPALKEANIGLAVDTSSDIAKDSADIILLKKNLKTIIDGIIIGRTIFVNTFNYLKITLASNLGNFYSIAIISLFIPFLPLLPLQILLVNFLSDAPMITISTDNVNPQEIAQPTNYNMKQLVLFIIVFGILSSVFDFVFFYNFYKSETTFFQTHWFIFSIFTEILFIFSARTKLFFIKATKPSFWLSMFSIFAILVTVAIPFTTVGQKIFSFISPTYSGLLLIGGIGLAYFIACEICKLFYYFFLSSSYEN